MDDADATLERLVERTDCTVLNGPLTIDAANARAMFVEDPDGYGVEIFHRLEPDD